MLDHLRNGLIDIQNIGDNECFKWSLVRYLHPADHNPGRISKVDKDFPIKLHFKDMVIPFKVRDIHKIEKNTIDIIVPIGYYFLLKISIHQDHSLYCGRKHFCCCCLQAFIPQEIFNHHIKDCF